MRTVFLLFIFMFFAQVSNAQTTVSFGGSVATMMASPSLFEISEPPLGFGVNMKVLWPGRYTGFLFCETGFDNFKFQTAGQRKVYDWNYLRFNLGKRFYTVYEYYGFYVDVAAGFYGVLPSGFGSKNDVLKPGGGGFLGLGYSKKLIDFGVQAHISVSEYGVAVNPVFKLGINITQ